MEEQSDFATYFEYKDTPYVNIRGSVTYKNCIHV